MNMNRYTIYCTPEQTKKALNLNAPLEIGEGKGTVLCRYRNYHTYKRCVIPTAEQIIGWLEEQGIRFSISSILIGHYEQGKIITDNITYEILVNKDDTNIKHGEDYSSRKEATIAAIDAALDYLSNNK